MNTQTTERRAATLRAGDISLPLTTMEITGAITGLLHHTKVCQTFVNNHDVPLEAIYTHPLPPKASVHGFRLVIGDRVISGVVQERGQARQAYREAVNKGHRAALMEEERSDIFTTTVGNIAPGEKVSITFELTGPLEYLESTASLHFPLVVPEVYISGTPLDGADVGVGVSSDTDSVPDASRITPPRLPYGAANPVDLRLRFTVDPAGLELEGVSSLCHFAKSHLREDGLYEISLLPGMERMDRDFVVQMRLREGSLQTTLIHDPESGTFALTVVPPVGSGKTSNPRDLVIVIDRSGSMSGWSMTAARRAAARMVESLTPADRFNIIAFDDVCDLYAPGLVEAEAKHQQFALEFLSKIDARGGTEARPAIEAALNLMNRENSRDKTVLFVTDGDVGNDSELVVRSASGIRVSTVGIGRNSRAGVLESMAKISGGLCTLIPEESTLEESLRNLHQRLGRPHWMGLSLSNHQDPDPAPRFWDVWEGVPTTFFGKAPKLPEQVEVQGWLTSQGKFSEKVAVLRRDDLVIHRSWARARLLDLDDLWTIGKVQPADLVKVSVEAQVLCRFTAFVAIDKSEVVENSESMKSITQPVEPTLAQNQIAQAPPGGVLARLRSAAPTSQILGAVSLSESENECDALYDIGGGGGDLFASYDDSDDCFGAPASAPAPAPAMRCEALDFAIPCESAPEPPAPEGGTAPTAKRMLSSPLSSPLSSAVEAARRGVDAAKSMFKKAEIAKEKSEKVDSFWSEILRQLEQLAQLQGDARRQLLEEMITSVGAFHRKLPSNSPSALISQQVMSLLVDLQQAQERGNDEAPTLASLRAVVGAAEHLPE